MRQQAKPECVDITETKMAKYIAIVMLEKTLDAFLNMYSANCVSTHNL